MDWKRHLKKRIVVEEYYVHIETQRGVMKFRARYFTHNGYTVLEPLTTDDKLGKDFMEWLKHRIDFNTRYDKPYWYKPIRLNRQQKIVEWAVETVQRAYNQYYQEQYDAVRRV